MEIGNLRKRTRRNRKDVSEGGLTSLIANDQNMILKMKFLAPILAVVVFAMAVVNSVFGFTSKGIPAPIIDQYHLPVSGTSNDAEPYAAVVLYRPDNQYSRKYSISTNANGVFEISKREAIRFEAHSSAFIISVDASGHRKETFTFNLSQGKTHYFRIQDRNNYSGFRVFLEVIEVTEETFNREIL